jgi:hypothetical protein
MELVSYMLKHLKPVGERPLGRPKRRLEDNIKMVLKESVRMWSESM